MIDSESGRVTDFAGSSRLDEPEQAPMKVLVVGNGGREHALAWKIRQ
ncbi:MAG: hypothetical protein DMF82_01450, partial [Acidobacteria bacterium]